MIVYRRNLWLNSLLDVVSRLLQLLLCVKVLFWSPLKLVRKILLSQTYYQNFSLSYASCDRYRRKANYELSQIINNNWKQPQIYNIHWDSNIEHDLKDSGLEIMPVLISAGQETKLLGVPSFNPCGGVAVGSVI